MPATRDVPTELGLARLWIDDPADERADAGETSDPAQVRRSKASRSPGPLGRPTLVLGHGAGGGVQALDLLAARDAGLAAGLRVVRVEQPWRVAGRRIATPPSQLDAVWLEVCAGLPGPLIVGGRSTGARVACRTATATTTATATGAVAVLCLAFPLLPPGGRPSRTGELSRAGELILPTVPILIVQGSRDAFGVPVGARLIEAADHAFAVRKKDGRSATEVAEQIRSTITEWFAALL